MLMHISSVEIQTDSVFYKRREKGFMPELLAARIHFPKVLALNKQIQQRFNFILNFMNIGRTGFMPLILA